MVKEEDYLFEVKFISDLSRNNLLVFHSIKNDSYYFDLKDTNKYCEAIAIEFQPAVNSWSVYALIKNKRKIQYGFYKHRAYWQMTAKECLIKSFDYDDDIQERLQQIGIVIIGTKIARLKRQLGKKNYTFDGSCLYEIISNPNQLKTDEFIAILKNKDATNIVAMQSDINANYVKNRKKVLKKWNNSIMLESKTPIVETPIMSDIKKCFAKIGIFKVTIS